MSYKLSISYRVIYLLSLIERLGARLGKQRLAAAHVGHAPVGPPPHPLDLRASALRYNIYNIYCIII